MHSTHLRKEHIHGALLGIAIGEALGYARDGLSRRAALKIFGPPPLHYAFLPGRGIYGDNTRLTLLNAQALLNSRSDLRGFRRAFSWRLSWYLLSIPVGASGTILTAAARSWLMRLRVAPGVNSPGSEAAARAIFSALATNGTGHRLAKWTEESTKLTHVNPQAIDGCKVLAVLADCGVGCKLGELDVLATLEKATESSSDPELSKKLKELRPFLDDKRSPSTVARHLGWDGKIPDRIVPTTTMATYCWLRYPTDFRRAIGSAIALGGSTATLGALVGGLVGGHIGQSEMPSELRQRLGGNPHGPDWIEALADRFSHWPHGADDLHLAPAQTSDPMMQIVRNVWILPVSSTHFVWRIINRATLRPTPRRYR